MHFVVAVALLVLLLVVVMEIMVVIHGNYCTISVGKSHDFTCGLCPW